MGSDLFESYVGSIISAVTLAAVAAANQADCFDEMMAALFPLVLSGVGIIASLIGIFIVRGKEGLNPCKMPLNMGTYVLGIINNSYYHTFKGNAGIFQLCHSYNSRFDRRHSQIGKDHRNIYFC